MESKLKFPDPLKDPRVKRQLDIVGYLGVWNRLSDSKNHHLETTSLSDSKNYNLRVAQQKPYEN